MTLPWYDTALVFGALVLGTIVFPISGGVQLEFDSLCPTRRSDCVVLYSQRT